MGVVAEEPRGGEPRMITTAEEVRVGTGYCDVAWQEPGRLIQEMRVAMKGVKYDTMVGTGLSGALIIPTLARALRKKFLIVRKDAELEHSHASGLFVGLLGQRWVFVDDFISSGDTYGRVFEKVGTLERSGKIRRPIGCSCCSSPVPFAGTTHVGSYEYSRENFTAARWIEDAEHDTRLLDTTRPPHSTWA